MDIQSILAEHKKWLADPSTGARADLQHADLQHADLRSADLRSADLRNADLRNADLRGANLQYADLQSAIGLVYLTQTDAGYPVLAQQPSPDAPWRIRAGCHDFSIEEAIEEAIEEDSAP